MLSRGVAKAAQKFYVSLVHTDAEVTRTLEVFEEALAAVAGTSH
jgi:glutamate-1-semialdehyde aminotransferase